MPQVTNETAVVSMEIWQATVLIISSTAAISLNSLIYFLVYRNRNLQTPFNFSILNVCFADILVSINMFLSAIYLVTQKQKIANKQFCDATGFITLLSFVASVMCLAAVSFNRYFMVCHWRIYKKVFTKKGIVVYIFTTWVFSVLISIPPFFGWGRFSYQHGKAICFADWNASISYMIFMIAICFCGPLSVTLVSLYFILRTKRNNSYKLDDKIAERESVGEITRAKLEKKRQQAAREERKITFSIVVIAVVFMVAWGPFVVVMFMETLGKKHIPHWIDFATLFLGCLNSTANPIVYLTLNSNFRKDLLKLFRRMKQGETSETKSATLENTPRLTPRLLRLDKIKDPK